MSYRSPYKTHNVSSSSLAKHRLSVLRLIIPLCFLCSWFRASQIYIINVQRDATIYSLYFILLFFIPATLPEGFPCFFLSCKANDRCKYGTRSALFLISSLCCSMYCFELCCSMYCFCRFVFLCIICL